ncbi:GntR family transcriptional regulator [Oceanibium sediminis]|uniref:GntR family transcriptional regulator n=1 Tax=Oceanibium sediminis TaxID=2026339 RepID=UPI000DD2F40D|nr:GntR family transcriptional regulator [Oceanibium sediminis]
MERKPLTAARSALTPIKKTRTAAEEVEERLILAIAMGDKAPGERITEAEIARALDVSRVPVREAMQKLLLRGVLTESGQRGLRVLDYSGKWIAEVFELRMAIERIIFQHVMAVEDRSALIEDLERIVARMAAVGESADPVSLSSADLEFHRTVARHAGSKLTAQIWEGLAQHLMIVFCRDWSRAPNRAGEVQLHEELVAYLRNGSIDDLDEVLRYHFSGPGVRPPAESS